MEVDFKKISQNTVKKFLLHRNLNKAADFSGLQSVCFDPAYETTCQKHLRSYSIRQNIDAVWNIYKSIHPREAWCGEMVSFGLQYSRKDTTINYVNDPYPGLEVGQIIIMNLQFLWGLFHIAVAHEVAAIDEKERMIKLCYMDGGASEGSQWITLHETSEGFTEVSHLTLYKSNSNFRDTKLYPWLHNRVITEFHLNIKKKAELLNR